MIEAKIIADSITVKNVRLTTFILKYPRFIHSEVATHRTFSRNASSSRAIPIAKQIEMIKNNPATPLSFLENKKGMQGGEPIANQEEALKVWLEARDKAVEQAEKLLSMNIAKQYVNRILEPFAHITVVCTATDYDNFFALRCHKDAQPEIQELANKMYSALQESTPEVLKDGEWHLPFVTDDDRQEAINSWHKSYYSSMPNEYYYNRLLTRSVAKCARVSYLNHDGTGSTFEQDRALFDRLLGSVPKHSSPAEHCAMAVSDPNIRSGNFRGWIQFRKTLENENVEEFKKEV